MPHELPPAAYLTLAAGLAWTLLLIGYVWWFSPSTVEFPDCYDRKL